MLSFNEGVSYFDAFGRLWSRCLPCRRDLLVSIIPGRRDLLVSMLPYLDPFGCRRTRTIGLGCAPPVVQARLRLNCLFSGACKLQSEEEIETGRALLRLGYGEGQALALRRNRDREGSPTGVCRDREVSPTGSIAGSETGRVLLHRFMKPPEFNEKGENR